MFVAGCGDAYVLGVQRRFRDAVPEASRGQAFGLFFTGLMTAQGIAPALCGLLTDVLPIGVVIAVMGGCALVTAAVVRARWRTVVSGGTDEPACPVDRVAAAVTGAG
jgi:hypothetical protein